MKLPLKCTHLCAHCGHELYFIPDSGSGVGAANRARWVHTNSHSTVCSVAVAYPVPVPKDPRSLTNEQLFDIFSAALSNENEGMTQFVVLYRIWKTRSLAEWVGQWDKQIKHPYKMEDVINCKFNAVTRKKPRRKKLATGR
jgi:hypothetical protein